MLRLSMLLSCIFMTNTALDEKHLASNFLLEKREISQDFEKYSVTCYICVNVSDNLVCNQFAIDRPCKPGKLKLIVNFRVMIMMRPFTLVEFGFNVAVGSTLRQLFASVPFPRAFANVSFKNHLRIQRGWKRERRRGRASGFCVITFFLILFRFITARFRLTYKKFWKFYGGGER